MSGGIFSNLPAGTREFIKSKGKQCKFIQQAIDRFSAQLSDPRFIYDEKRVNQVHSLIGKFSHFTGNQFKGKSFKLLPWQSFTVASLFGLKWRASGFNVYRQGYIQVPRKNGKSEFAAALAIVRLLIGDEAPEIYFTATTEAQSKKPWMVAKKFLAGSKFKKFLKFYGDKIILPRRNGECRYLASDSEKQDGLNVEFGICDEVHAWPSRDMYDVLEGGTGMRDNPLILSITTAAHGKKALTSFCYTLRQEAIDAMNGARANDSFFTLIFEPDEGDDPYSEETWYKCNPSLGPVKKIEYMRIRAQSAKSNPTYRKSFLAKQLDQWIFENETWEIFEKWRKQQEIIPDEKLSGKYCYVGLDLSAVRDLTALVLFFPRQDGLEKAHVIAHFWIPRIAALAEDVAHQIPYEAWGERGFCDLIKTETIDQSLILSKLEEYAQKYTIKKVGYDRYGATNINLKIESMGFSMERINQGAYLSPTLYELERMIYAGEITHAQNEILDWNINNVRLEQGGRSNKSLKLTKNSDWQKIDGVAALASALDICIKDAQKEAEAQGINTIEAAAQAAAIAAFKF